MSSAPFEPKAYLENGCPFSFKLLLFLAEAGMTPEVELTPHYSRGVRMIHRRGATRARSSRRMSRGRFMTTK